MWLNEDNEMNRNQVPDQAGLPDGTGRERPGESVYTQKAEVSRDPTGSHVAVSGWV